MSDPQRRETISEADIEIISDADVLVPPPSAARRFASSAWEQVNPMGLVDAVRHPIQTVQNIGQAQGREGMAAAEALKAGDYATALRHGLGYLLPLIGPVLCQQGEKMAGGDIAGGLGGTLGLATAALGPKAVGGVRSALPQVPGAARMAAAAEAGIEPRVSNVMAPKIGPNKTGDRAMLAVRLAARQGHYMPASLLDSQLSTLETPDPDERAITLDAGGPTDRLVQSALTQLRAPPP